MQNNTRTKMTINTQNKKTQKNRENKASKRNVDEDNIKKQSKRNGTERKTIEKHAKNKVMYQNKNVECSENFQFLFVFMCAS